MNVKYDAWHKDVLSKFGHLLGNELQEFHSHVSKSRTDLESQSVEAASTSEAVDVITYVQSLKRKLNDWEKKVTANTYAQKILERQRYQFLSNLLYTDYIQVRKLRLKSVCVKVFSIIFIFKSGAGWMGRFQRDS